MIKRPGARLRHKARARDAGDAGFTLLEMLIAAALMVAILAALATITAQWLPNWNRGLARVQRAELLMMGLERIVADLSAAEFISPHNQTKNPLFEGSELSVTFVRAALGPNNGRGLEVVRLAEVGEAGGVSLVRFTAPFVPLSSEASVSSQLRFQNPVVLIRAPYRVAYSYAGPDRAWRGQWVGEQFLPRTVRILLRDATTGQTLSASTVAPVRVWGSAECVRLKDPRTCTVPRVVDNL